MVIYGILLLVGTLWIRPSLQAPPFISGTPITWNLFEDVADDHRVGCITCVHTLPTTVSLVSVAVNQGAVQRCLSCFSIRQISPVSDFCLFYSKNTVPTPAETLDFSLAQRYNVIVECSDGAESVQADVDLRIVPNAAPVFTGSLSITCPTPIDAASVGASQYVYTGVVATDSNGDTIVYSMTSDPVNDVFDIEASTGKIYTLLPASRFCYHTVIFYITVTDSKTPPTGPLTITCPITNYNTAPMVSNANRDYYIDEDLAVGMDVYTLMAPPPLPVTYTISDVQPNSANSLFTFAGNNLQVAAKLNYEDVFKRNPNITITADNGQCPPEDYWMHVHIRDKNDLPVATPKAITHTQAEGTLISFNLDTTLSVTDEDVEDFTFDYTIVAGNPTGLWTVNAAHDLTSTVIWDREVHGTGATLTLQVADRKGPAFDTLNVTMVITDVNDNPPIMVNPTYSFTVTECTAGPVVLGTLVATDNDSSDNNNNIIVFDTISASGIGIDAAGKITLLSNLSIGMTPSVMVGASDLGTPPLTSAWKSTVSISVSACPPPTTPTPPPAINVVTTDSSSQCNNAPSGTVANWWAQIAALLAAFLNGN